ncbi:MAG: 50S ribosomal protein L35 [Oligoflexia bacterium]|nr:50S ribosomal protein L35 [Oligoflexia bacterium]
MKTKRAVLKRLNVTANRKLKFRKTGLGHKLSKKSADTKRQKGIADYVKVCDQRRMIECLPYSY